jgi:hypothetical protein
MEASDPFATQDPADQADPFADSPEPDMSDPAAEIEAEAPVEEPTVEEPTVEPPVVDREGEPVAPPEANVEVEGTAQPDPPVEEPPAAPQSTVEAPQEPGEPPAQPKTQNGPGPRGGKGTMRHYKILFQTGPRQWTEHPLEGELPEGVKVHTDAKGERWIEARNNDHATRVAYVVLGQPVEGAMVWPAPEGAFKPKKVKPAAPKPERTRLEIS